MSKTRLPANIPVIGNKHEPPKVPKGFSKGYQQRDYEKIPFESYAPGVGDDWLIPREEWYDRAMELEKNKARVSDVIKDYGWRVLDQNGTNYCWINGVAAACEMVRCMQGHSYVRLSPASGGSLIKSFRNVGGWGDQAAEFIAEKGLVPAEFWPQNKIDRQYNTPENWDRAKDYILTEWNELRPRSMDELFSCLLRGRPCPVGYNWWSHLICAVDVVVFSEPSNYSDRDMMRSFGILIANSWSERWGEQGYGILKENKMLPDGHLVVRSMHLAA